MNEPLVTMASLQKRFGRGAFVLQDINLDVQKGEFVSLIGPSGCGKSTLLRLIAALSPVTSGKLMIDGMKPEKARKETSFVFQDATLLPWRTVRRNIELPLEVAGRPSDEREKVCENMRNLVGLDRVPNLYPRQLSGGMKMRVSIARALSVSPKLLLLDEPFGALDEITRDRLNEELLRIREKLAFTAFFVTHSVSEAAFLSSRIIILGANPGRIEKDLRVPFPYPRNFETRESRDFQMFTTEVSRELRGVNTEPR